MKAMGHVGREIVTDSIPSFSAGGSPTIRRLNHDKMLVYTIYYI